MGNAAGRTIAGFVLLFAAGAIEVAEGQCVIDSGLDAVVSHPMYAGPLTMIAGIPLALRSWWRLLPAAWLVPDYQDRVRRRLASKVW